jgi:hypothetical protein
MACSNMSWVVSNAVVDTGRMPDKNFMLEIESWISLLNYLTSRVGIESERVMKYDFTLFCKETKNNIELKYHRKFK